MSSEDESAGVHGKLSPSAKALVLAEVDLTCKDSCLARCLSFPGVLLCGMSGRLLLLQGTTV